MKKLALLFALAFMTVSLYSCRDTNRGETERPIEEVERDVDDNIENEEDIDEAAREAEIQRREGTGQDDDLQ